MRRTTRSMNDTLSSNDTIESDNVTLSGLLKTKWQVYHTSLLLERSRRDLRSKILATTRLIAQENPKNKSVVVTLTTCPGIRPNDDSPKALLVEVSINKKQVYVGYFINWSLTQEPIENLEALPMLLVKAKPMICRLVNNALIKVFDFVVTPFEMNSMQLVSMFALFIRFSDKEGKGAALLKYTVPGCPASNFITTSTRIRDLTLIFDYYNHSELDEHQPVQRIFYEKVLNHFHRVFQLDLSRAQLHQVSFPDAFATSTGQIRMTNEDILSASLVALGAIFSRGTPPPPPSSLPDSDS